jgi:excisionase family DNA binding protein
MYRINAAAALLGVSRSTIYRFVKTGKLKLLHIGENSSGITADSIAALQAAGHRTTPDSSAPEPGS